MTYAIVDIGGAQHRVSPGDTIKVQRLLGGSGESVSLDRVLAVQTGEGLVVGTPLVAGAVVRATLLGEGKTKKIIVFKKKKRKQYRRTRGHRQILASLRIDEIVSGS